MAARIKVRRHTSYSISDGETGREFETEMRPVGFLDAKVRYLPDGRAVVGYLVDDPDAPSPREDDNFGTMVCWHDRYDLGDEHSHEKAEDLWKELIDDEEYERIDELTDKELEDWSNAHPGHKFGRDWEAELDRVNARMRELVREAVDKVAIVLPLYLYDHSGITMSTSRTGQFADRWDSSAVGYIYVTNEAAMENWSCKTLDDPVDYRDGTVKPCRERALDLLVCEVEEYDKHIMNEHYTAAVVVFGPDNEKDESFETDREDCLGTQYAEEEMSKMVDRAFASLTKEKHDGEDGTTTA